MSVYPDHGVRRRHVNGGHSRPHCGRGVGLPDGGGRRRRCSKGSQRSGVDLHDPEPSPAGLLWVSDLHSGEEMVQRPDVHQRGGGGLWSTAVTAHQSRVAVGAHQVAAGFQTQTPGDRVSIQEVMAVCVICGSSPRIGAASSHPKQVRCRPSGPSG